MLTTTHPPRVTKLDYQRRYSVSPGRIADRLAAQVHSTGRPVASLAEHDQRQLENVRRWLNDRDPNVRAFAERLLASLQVSLEQHSAHEEYERRRWGT